MSTPNPATTPWIPMWSLGQDAIPNNQKGQPNGVATLDATGLVPISQLPAAGAGSQLDYAQITTSTAAITVSTEATAAAVITGNSVSYDGSKVKIEFYCNVMSTQVQATFVVLRDATVVGQATFMNYANNASSAYLAEMFDTPAAGAHTYAVKVFTVAGNSVTVKAGPGGSGNLSPTFLRVTKA
jgi:hypothetical protein